MRRGPAFQSLTGGAPFRCTLPVSGLEIGLCPPTGQEDVLLAGLMQDDPAVILRLAHRLAQAPSDRDFDWGALSVADIDTLLMRLRQSVLGDEISASLLCAAPECGSRATLSFSIETYLAHHRPRPGALRKRGWRWRPAEDGWFHLMDARLGEVRFRLPTLHDQIAVAHVADAAQALARRCIGHDKPTARLAARVQAVMAALAPPLAGTLNGLCPECGAGLAAHFEARHYSLQELKNRAAFIFDDVDALAERYHWSERAILQMPPARRGFYAERARQSRWN